jgi:hypothetical protein
MIRPLRFFAVVAAAVTVTTSLSAAELIPLSSNGATVADLVERLREARQEKVRTKAASVHPTPNVIGVDWETESFIIPVAGSLAGGGGTFFRSDVTIANRRSQSQIISIGFLQRGVNNGNAAVQRFTLGANSTTITNDFIKNALGTSGLGTLLIVAETSTGAVDTNAQIDGFSRIWTNQPNASGTVSQSFEAIELQDSLATSYAYGLRHDESFRTNVGLVNLYSTSNTFTVAIVGLRGNNTFTQTVQPYSMEQVAVPAGIYGDLYLRITSASNNFNWWSAYGTSVDNITGDGWVSHVH